MMHVMFLVIILISIPQNSYNQWTEADVKKYINENLQDLNEIEGIWSVNISFKEYNAFNYLVNSNNYQAVKWAIRNWGTDLRMAPIDPSSGYKNVIWISPTASKGVYYYKEIFEGSRATATANMILNSSGVLKYSYNIPEQHLKYLAGAQYSKRTVIMEYEAIKLYPSAADIVKNIPKQLSGTGFAITSSGVIVTNYHVVEKMNTIKVRGVNGNFYRTYKAKILFADRNNDLALIRISDYSFSKIENIPYSIKSDLSSVGESVFVLGYPLRASMGDEIKLTNGIISSKTGYQGDVSSYQISAPVQPGNSGGPLFDSQGNIIGIINAKHIGAENVSYAIKSRYLLNLVDLMGNPPDFPSSSPLAGKSLSEQAEIVKKFVYIIDSE